MRPIPIRLPLAAVLTLALAPGSCTTRKAPESPPPAPATGAEMDKEAEAPAEEAMKPMAAKSAPMKRMKAEAKADFGGLDMDDGAPGGAKDTAKEKTKGGKKTETWKRSTLLANTSRLMIGDREELPVRGMQMQAQVDGFRARVLIDFYFYNDRDRQFEGTFKLRLPDGASPYFLAFGQTAYKAPEGNPRYDMVQVAQKRRLEPQAVLDQRKAAWIEPKVARLVPKEKAAFAYQDTVRRRVDPALMEWSGSGVFSSRIFPIEPRKLHRVVIGYDMDLTRAGDDLEMLLPLPSGLPSSVVDLDLAALQGVKVEVEPEAERKEQKGRIHLRLENPQVRAVKVRLDGAADLALTGDDPDTGPYFAARFVPDLPDTAASGGAGNAVFLVDVSLSANPDGFNVWLKLLRAILDNNRNGIRKFAVLFFNVESFWYKKGFVPNTPAEVEKLEQFARGLALEGATDLEAALREAVEPSWSRGKPPRVDLFLLGDGGVTWGEGDQHALSLVLDGGRVNALFAYRTGIAGGDSHMLEHLARESGGAVFSVVGEDEVTGAATAHTRRPWKLRRAEVAGAEDILLAGRPRALFPGQRVTLAGRGKLKANTPVVLHLEQGDRQKKVATRLSRVVDSGLAPRVYGQIAVSQLDDFLQATGPRAEAYARHFRVTGRSTSLLMLESEADYERYGIVPEDDAEVVRDKTVRILLAHALDALAQRLGDPKAAFLSWLDKLKEIPGTSLKLPADAARALEALPRKAFAVEVPRLVCKRHDLKVVPGPLQELLVQRKPTYDAVSADALARKQRLGPADGLKALSSLVEVSPGDGVLARDIGFTAMEWGLAAQAYHLFRRVARARPFEPQTYRALALCLAEQDKPELAMAYYELGMAGEWDSRFGEFKTILRLDYLRFLGRLGNKRLDPAIGALAAQRRKSLRDQLGIERADLLITITWNTDNTDVDLHVIEPGGEECYYSHPETKSGGRLTRDVTQGYGPEMYILPEAPAGTYLVRAKYFASDQARASARTKVYATVTRDWGTPRERVQRKVLTLAYGKELHDVAELKLP